MDRLYCSILYMCLKHGEVCSLLDLADSLDMNYKLAWFWLNMLELRDPLLRVARQGRGRRLRITYAGNEDKVITILNNRMYRENYETSGRSNHTQRRLYPVRD